VITGVAPRPYAFVTANPWKLLDQSAYHMTNCARFPTSDVHLSHAVIPGLPSGAPSIATPLMTVVGDAAMTADRSAGAVRRAGVASDVEQAAPMTSARPTAAPRRWVMSIL
jgi:hypothetical protein